MQEQQNTTSFLILLAKMASVVTFIGGGIAAFNHFAGYSYLKGRIFGMGLGQREVALSQQEITFQTSQFLSDFHKNALHDTSLFLGIGWIPTLIFIVIGGIFLQLMFPKSLKKKVTQTPESVVKTTLKHRSTQWIKNLIGYSSMFAVSFYGLLFTFLILLTYLAGVLSVAYKYGVQRGQADISQEVCISLKNAEEKQGRKSGCTAIYIANGESIYGKIVYHNENMSLMLTNTESFILDNKGNFTACAPIFDLTLAVEEQPYSHCQNP